MRARRTIRPGAEAGADAEGVTAAVAFDDLGVRPGTAATDMVRPHVHLARAHTPLEGQEALKPKQRLRCALSC